MSFKIITADERLQKFHINGVIFGPHKIGKTSQLWTLDPATTLFGNLEAGDLSVSDWQGDSFVLRDWETARNFACFLSGPNPAYRPDQPYSQAHYDYVVEQFGDPSVLKKYETIFIDSITVAGRLCFQWSQGQPQAFSERSGKPDIRGAYGLHGQEMIKWLTTLQHVEKNIWFVGLLDEKTDDFNRTFWTPQIDGSKTGLELPGIVDQVISMAELKTEDGELYRAFVCTRPNPWGFPAGDRSGKLNMVEEPNLGALMHKIKTGKRNSNLEYTLPQPKPKTEETV